MDDYKSASEIGRGRCDMGITFRGMGLRCFLSRGREHGRMDGMKINHEFSFPGLFVQ
jgi:hypothetical protein